MGEDIFFSMMSLKMYLFVGNISQFWWILSIFRLGYCNFKQWVALGYCVQICSCSSAETYKFT